MIKRFCIVFMIVCLILVNTNLVFASTESNDLTTGVPESILKKADSKVIRHEIPEIKAWETDAEGNTIEIVPKNMKLISNETINLFSPPNDGYIYKFTKYVSQNATKNWYYENLGTFRFSNRTQTPVNNVNYTQERQRQSQWSVSGNISGSTAVKVKFLAEIKVQLGVEGSYSRTWQKNFTYGASYTVPPMTTYYLTNYQVGLNSNGYLVYDKWHPEGYIVGTYTESCGGTAVSTSDVHIELTDQEPIR